VSEIELRSGRAVRISKGSWTTSAQAAGAQAGSRL